MPTNIKISDALVHFNEKNFTFKLKEFKFKRTRCIVQAVTKKEEEIERDIILTTLNSIFLNK